MKFRSAFLGLLHALLALSTTPAIAQSSATMRAFGGAPYGLTARQLAVVINQNDPASVEAGAYYVKARGVPAENVIRVHLPHGAAKLAREQFETLRATLDAQAPAAVQALLLVWTTPYAVECNAITAALTLGLDEALCSRTCAPSRPSPYYDSASLRPRDDLSLRISMLLPADDIAMARALIDRGVAADRRMPRGTAYLVKTADANRNTRAAFYPRDAALRKPPLRIRNLESEALDAADDVMFYLTGRAWVDNLDTLRFLPGALADHLTSSGGDLLGKHQMSSLRWLDAGATASYGTVSEPCNHWQKFPNPAVLIKHYALGASAIEAYWKSVAWPAQGLFIGEPLAAPYRR
ncbi:MAG TPA: TIGR03790 family protein [Rhodocyclaceae bacterium]|nr:TIGR03790 family protein [Rhodocyclaceae bacterium]HMZ83875.1 TIGR03790 family protein [Rhodocyclaceae bacterium]